ncbi:MAG: succinate dehydrogenase/fumarate reductase iron-sulfur subunit [Gemmatimonadales bacterium]|nr:succinate dehydrogenase/fumarate reductase iron-sulfur subunit [Gemmatimonadales bacterium]NIN11905.1 succinate dehydrogenase/fumarate reductase iron-sulfur subunit [Gemmatimonadales bacterium]NIN50455.1 succinate dehydrogenase/fumarate reductase iron-sulfur subunit [Gemmatimonadales bacterium]NIP07919.1 succinate dehydrogenase/fumarate reductase iron-sulfur subunit [Gemmatimonadales bacterium]NIR01943.1 succinate dehydrogenase/fumarate reductase iron-sulfur subunit [Gemmatimonadales bacteri
MDLILHVWRQASPAEKGRFVRYEAKDVSEHASFLEMLDIVNERLTERAEEPIAFEHDCREGICGSCGIVINGYAHGPQHGAATCQLHMRHFSDGDEIWIEPWRAKAFPVIKDLVVDRSAFDRIMQVGGFIAARTGSAPDANAIPVPKDKADLAMDAAACIGCGACVAACPNASAMLFVSAKVCHLGLLPQGQPERRERVLRMIGQMDAEGFGSCTNHAECQAACPKEISVDFIARLNRDLFGAALTAV